MFCLSLIDLDGLFFQSDEVFVGFSFSDDGEFAALNKDFGCPTTGVIVARHSEGISTCGEYG